MVELCLFEHDRTRARLVNLIDKYSPNKKKLAKTKLSCHLDIAMYNLEITKHSCHLDITGCFLGTLSWKEKMVVKKEEKKDIKKVRDRYKKVLHSYLQLQLLLLFCTLHFAFCTLYFAFCTLYFALYIPFYYHLHYVFYI